MSFKLAHFSHGTQVNEWNILWQKILMTRRKLCNTNEQRWKVCKRAIVIMKHLTGNNTFSASTYQWEQTSMSAQVSGFMSALPNVEVRFHSWKSMSGARYNHNNYQ